MKCPACKEAVLVISERKGIEIDYCPDCRGIWLDRGELDKLLEKSREESDSRPEPRRDSEVRLHPQPHDHYYSKPYKRKKSLLEELFD
jgi:Zn-finger nucleic acid-binding protein